MQIPLSATLSSLRRGLDLRPDQMDTTNLMPIFVPSSFFSIGNWPGPYSRLRAPEIGLTWTLLLPNQGMRYVDFAMQEYWEANQLDWKALALGNLGRRTNGQPGLRAIRRANGEVSALAFMFEDGLGPSRLLCRGTLEQQFPAGYRVSMPEMSCGIAFGGDLEGQEMATVQGVIDACYRNGTRPLSPRTYDPDDLLPSLTAS